MKLKLLVVDSQTLAQHFLQIGCTLETLHSKKN